MAKGKGQPLPNVIRVYCEGAKTEPLYISGFIDSLPDTRRRFVVAIEPTKKNTPVQLVDEAVSYKKSKKYVPGDLLWVVYDREGAAKYSNELHAKAYDKAQKNGINVALSNVCFEYWLILHIVDTSAPATSYDEFCKSTDFKRLFKDFAGFDYDKAGAKVFGSLSSGVALARQRAERINAVSLESAPPSRKLPFHLNPYSNVYELLEDIETLRGKKTRNETLVAK